MIQADHLTKKFGRTNAVQDISFFVPAGSLFGLLGPDGSGKSTTLRLLSGILRPSAGKAQVAGFDTIEQADQVKANSRYMSQGFDLYTDLTIEENLHFFASMLGISKEEQKSKIAELLAFTRLAPFHNRLAAKLSGGMKQKLALAVALVYTPKVLFLDEPTGGVDPVSRRDFWIALEHLRRQGVTLFITTSYLEEAERCEQVGLLHEGRLLALGSPQELKKSVPLHVVEIETAYSRKAVAYLRKVAPGARVDHYGSKLHFTQRADAELLDPALLLQKVGMHVVRERVIPPTLEDLFIALIAQKDTSMAYAS